MKQLNLICLLFSTLLILSCDKDEPQPALTEEEMVIGNWQRTGFRREIYDVNGGLVGDEYYADTEFTITYTKDKYTLSSRGHVETGTYDFKVDQDTRYLQLEEINNTISRTLFIDSVSRSKLDFHYTIDQYSNYGEPVYIGRTVYYEFYKKKNR
ncbi:hypothetical protein H8S95_00980 [Pontibacter sp. KCTC 32443]|uniref:hypothetical protein n=1 Tax=Pontibacter TaxID=323449 RepID=UPI00164EA138|nr:MULTISPECIES: hypothetical protein [Pontibacter]MBC5772620.1 hypothetical protein [Pontibacter sp. KCTC 32443]